MPLWWRGWMFLQVDVETADQPLTLAGLRTWESGYPFAQHGYFRSSDPALDRIWQVGWRTALVDAHDTYMDSAYWEQLQYVGDTRLQMLISYAVSGDARLAAQAIDAFAGSDVDGGLVEGAWPSRGSNSIATFSPLWIAMLARLVARTAGHCDRGAQPAAHARGAALVRGVAGGAQPVEEEPAVELRRLGWDNRRPIVSCSLHTARTARAASPARSISAHWSRRADLEHALGDAAQGDRDRADAGPPCAVRCASCATCPTGGSMPTIPTSRCSASR